MRLQLMTWPAVETYLRRGTAIILPIGSTEQHGPNGLIGTDAITSEFIANAVAEKTGAIVAPTIAVGMAQHHMAFPGSMTLRPSTMIAVLRDTVDSLARHGFTHFFFVNGHGGNIATITAAFSEIYAERSMAPSGNVPAVRCKLVNWWANAGVSAVSRELFGSQEGSHATPSEVALTFFMHPETESHPGMEPRVAPSGGFTDAADYRRNFPDGRIGSNPDLATPAHGKRIFEAAVEAVARDYAAWSAA